MLCFQRQMQGGLGESVVHINLENVRVKTRSLAYSRTKKVVLIDGVGR
jgi:hypothetical protein